MKGFLKLKKEYERQIALEFAQIKTCSNEQVLDKDHCLECGTAYLRIEDLQNKVLWLHNILEKLSNEQD